MQLWFTNFIMIWFLWNSMSYIEVVMKDKKMPPISGGIFE